MTVACDATAEVVTANVALEEVTGTETLAGTVAAAVLELESETLAPAGGPRPVRVTVPVEELPPTSAVGLRLRPERDAGLTVRVAVCAGPADTAERTTDVVDATVFVTTLKVAVVAPGLTKAAKLSTAAVFELVIVRSTPPPPAGAADASVTVALLTSPPWRVEGLSVKPETGGGTTLMRIVQP